MNENDTYRRMAFPRLDDAEIAALKTVGTMRHLLDGKPLFEAGLGRGGFFVVLAGAVEIVDRSGDETRTVTVHEPGEFTGDIDILSRRRPGVFAAGDVRLGSIKRVSSAVGEGAMAIKYIHEYLVEQQP